MRALRRVALPVPVHHEFDYRAGRDATADDIGRVVRVTLGSRRLLGVVVDQPAETTLDAAELATIESYAPDVPRVPPDVLGLARFAADYYQFPLGMTLLHAVPPRGRRVEETQRRAPIAYRLTALGRTGIESLPARAHAQARLAKMLGDGEAVDRSRLLEAVPAGRPTVLRWLRAGWIEPAEPLMPAAAAAEHCLPPLTAAQQAAVSAIEAAAGTYSPFLLHGITGSGKTEVYLACAARILRDGGQVLMLVPEINLTPQLAERVRDALPFAHVALLHSHVAAARRLKIWQDAAGGAAQFVLGTRLAIFAPLPRLGLVIVDEEHDGSYKQQDGLRYNARDLAVFRARERKIPIVLGSATPALESLWQARRGRYTLLRLPQRAGGAELPAVRLVPQRVTSRAAGGLTPPLLDALAANLARDEQSLIFVNRRGFAPSMLCVACTWAAACHRCSARLVVHLADRCLRCHHCGHQEPLPSACPMCGNQDLLPLGFGTQRLEAAVRETFPTARTARIDADSTRRREAWPQLLRAILDGRLDILIGTQMMVKGHDFPRLTLVGILGADNALYSADFRATERLYAQLTQVAGRAGRANRPGEVLIQTDFPDHSLYRALQTGDETGHVETLLAERRHLGLPPFTRLALVRAESRQRSTTDRFAEAAWQQAKSLLPGFPRVRINPPVAARMARRAGLERAQLLVQSESAGRLQAFLTVLRAWLSDVAPRGVRWSVDVDPLDVD